MTARIRRGALLLLIAALGSTLLATSATPAVDGIVPRAGQEVPLTVDSASFSGHWKESYLIGGKVAFKGTVGGAADLTATLRRADSPGVILSRASLTVAAAGAFSGTLRVPARPVTGDYVVRVTGTSESVELKAAETTVTIPAPPEGIVDKSSASRTENGAAVRRVKGPLKQLWARFHFVALPKASNVEIVWRTPSFKFVGAATKPAADDVTSFVKSTGAPLQKGVWYAFLRANGKIVKRVAVRIT